MPTETPVFTPCLIEEDGSTHYLSNPFSIGRSSRCSLALKKADVSRNHCEIEQRADDLWWITDSGSTNGTYVNENKIAGAVELKDGDYISTGETIFSFKYSSSNISKTKLPQMNTIVSSKTCWLILGAINGSDKSSSQFTSQDHRQALNTWEHLSKEIVESQSGKISFFDGGFIASWQETQNDCSSLATISLQKLEHLHTSCTLNFNLIMHLGDAYTDEADGRLLGSGVNLLFKSEKVTQSENQPCAISSLAASQMDKSKLSPLGDYTIHGNEEPVTFYTLL